MKSTTGFTLIETVVFIVVAGILALVFANFFRLGIDTFSLLDRHQELNQNGRIIFDHLGRQLMKGTLTAFAASDITFTSDLNNDGGIDTVRYYRQAADNTLHRVENGVDAVIMDNVSSLAFSRDLQNGTRMIVEMTIALDIGSQRLKTSFFLRQSSGV